MNVSVSLVGVNSKGLHKIHPPDRTFIQFACDSDQTVNGILETDRNSLFTKHLLKNITKKNVDVTEIFRCISDDVYRESNQKQKPLSMNGLHQLREIYLNAVIVSDEGKLGKSHIITETSDYDKPT
jgi:hypothetical protein